MLQDYCLETDYKYPNRTRTTMTSSWSIRKRGSSRIGQAIAIRFGQEGANVAISYHKGLAEAQHTEAAIREAMDQAVDSYMNQMKAAGVKTLLAQADVSQEADVQRMFQETIEGLGG